MNNLWCERYRPKCVDDLVIPERLKNYFKEMVSKNELMNMTLVGSCGIGKTSTAKALCDELDYDMLTINASETGNIDTIRTTIRNYASTMSFSGKRKVILLDEADSMTFAAQAALRGMIEEFSSNCRFILTGNYGNKIIDAIKSRCNEVDFSFTKEEREELLKHFNRRCKQILEENSIEYDKKLLAQILIKCFPDFRKTLNELQKHTMTGQLVENCLQNLSSDAINELASYLKNKKWGEMRKFIADNSDNEFGLFIRALYDRATTLVEPKSIPQMVLILNEYDYKYSFCVDKEVCIVACMTELMSELEWK